uniref:Membrane bound O-acyltransferase domain containing 1 n=1 Tax=Denticeps clupeoides TaxID=299321 RepID=A0AAY4ERK3_9TELE
NAVMEEESVTFRTTGSARLGPVSDFTGIPLDQVNFLACQFFALLAAFWFRLYLRPQYTSPVIRHAVATILGISVVSFCFGWYAMHILLLVFACYGILAWGRADNIHSYTMVTAVGYLTICQVSRVFIFNYGILSTDFSGPLMMITQKVTMLAFQVHDGEELSYNIFHSSKPSLLEYLSYNLNFLSILVGPWNNYKDYIDFIEGKHAERRLKRREEPSPMRPVIQKLLICAGCLLFFFTITKAFPVAYNADPDFISQAPFVRRLSYAFFSVQAARSKFYFAWTLADAIHNAAGYGIRGLNEKGEVCWDLISNVNIWGIETATSFKSFIDNWNIQTGIWLKSVCYDRVPYYHTAFTFVLSALWHGVYPGYYFTFLTGIPVTLAARAMRRNFRHHFLCSHWVKLAYDLVTWAATHLAICYTVMPFLLLAVEPTFHPLLFAAPFKLHQVGLEASVHSHFKISPEMFNLM